MPNLDGQIQLHPLFDLKGQTAEPSFSPDGKNVVFAWWQFDGKRSGIYIRPINGGEAQLLVGPDERGAGKSPRWSPDGKLIAFLRSEAASGAALFVKPATGGEERFLGVACNDSESWSGDSRSIIAPSHEYADPNSECRMNVYPVLAGEHSQQLEIVGNFPVVSPDGKMLAFVLDHEIRLMPISLDGKAIGHSSTLVRESSRIISPIWVPSSKEILYLLVDDLSRIQKIEIRAGSMPLDAGDIDGEFTSLAMSSRGELLGAIEVHNDSYWRADLRSPSPHPEKLRQLPWNVKQLKIAPDGNSIAYAVSERGTSRVDLSQLDASQPRHLFQTMYRQIEQLAWSPNGQEIAFTASPGFSQVEPSNLFIASTANGSPRRLLKESDAVYQATWSRDGKALYFVLIGSDGQSSVRKLQLADQKVIEITQGSAQQLQESTDGRFLYVLRNLELLRVPLSGVSPPEHLASGVLRFAAGTGQLYFERQDSKPPNANGLNLYNLDLETRASRLVANIGFVASSMQLSSDGQFLYFERHEPTEKEIMVVNGWH